MSGALRELIAFFGVEVDDKKLDHAGEKMEGLAKLAERVGATIGLAFGLHEIGEFIKGQVELGAELLHTSEILGLGVEELQAFQYAAVNAGLGADEANTALRFLNKNLGIAAEKGGDSAAVFEKLGVKIKGANGETRPTQEILGDVADGIAKLPGPAEKTAKAMELFGRAGARMIPLLNKGSKGIAEFYDEFEKLGGGISKEFAEQAEEGEHQMNKLNLAIKGGKSIIAAALLPAFTWAVDKAVQLVTWFRELSKHSYIVQTALGTLAVIVGALALVWAALNWEVLLVVLAIALLILVVDDVYTAFMGGKSVVGDFIDSLFGVGATVEIVDLLKRTARELWAELGYAYDAGKDLAGALASLGGESTKSTTGLGAVKEVIAGIGWVAKQAILNIIDLENAITKVIGIYAEFKKDHPTIAKVLEGVGGAATKTLLPGSGIGKDITNVSQLFDGGEPTIAPQGDLGYRGGHNGDVNNHTTIQVDVKGGPANADTGNAVAKGVQRGIDGSDTQAAYAAVPGGGS